MSCDELTWRSEILNKMSNVVLHDEIFMYLYLPCYVSLENQTKCVAWHLFLQEKILTLQ